MCNVSPEFGTQSVTAGRADRFEGTFCDSYRQQLPNFTRTLQKGVTLELTSQTAVECKVTQFHPEATGNQLPDKLNLNQHFEKKKCTGNFLVLIHATEYISKLAPVLIHLINEVSAISQQTC